MFIKCLQINKFALNCATFVELGFVGGTAIHPLVRTSSLSNGQPYQISISSNLHLFQVHVPFISHLLERVQCLSVHRLNVNTIS